MGLLFRDRVSTYPNRYKLNKADGTSEYVTLERADSPTQVGTPLNADTFNAMQRGHTPHNLLDNSDFRNPVNQRGQASYSGGVYGIDRWFGDNADSVLTTTENGIIATGAYLVQILERKHVGKVLTICVRDAKGGIAVATCTVQQATGYSWLCTDVSTTGTFVGILQTDTGVLRANVKNSGGVAIEWVALYEGEYTAETLPEYQPKGYAHELAECLRYYRQFDRECIGTGYTTGTGEYAIMCLPFTMRIQNPTVIGSGVYCRVNGNDYACDSLQIQNLDNMLHLVLHAPGAPAKYAAAFYANNLFALSAEL